MREIIFLLTTSHHLQRMMCRNPNMLAIEASRCDPNRRPLSPLLAQATIFEIFGWHRWFIFKNIHVLETQVLKTKFDYLNVKGTNIENIKALSIEDRLRTILKQVWPQDRQTREYYQPIIDFSPENDSSSGLFKPGAPTYIQIVWLASWKISSKLKVVSRTI